MASTTSIGCALSPTSNNSLSPTSIDFLRCITLYNADGTGIQLPIISDKDLSSEEYYTIFEDTFKSLFPNIPWDKLNLTIYDWKLLCLEADDSFTKDGIITNITACVFGNMDTEDLRAELKHILFSSRN